MQKPNNYMPTWKTRWTRDARVAPKFINRELKEATFLSPGRKPAVTIPHTRTVVSPRFFKLIASEKILDNINVIVLTICKNMLNRKIAHFRLSSVAQKRCMLSAPQLQTIPSRRLSHVRVHFTRAFVPR